MGRSIDKLMSERLQEEYRAQGKVGEGDGVVVGIRGGGGALAKDVFVEDIKRSGAAAWG